MKYIVILLLTIYYSYGYGQDKLTIPEGDTVKVDGVYNLAEWIDSDSVEITFLNNTKKVRIYYKHDGLNLLVCFKGNLESANVRFPEILIDPKNNRSTSYTNDDWWFHVSATDCEYKGAYGNYSNCALEKPSWKAVNNITPGTPVTDLVEIKIPFETIQLNPSLDTFGICFLITNTSTAFNSYPSSSIRTNPSTWAKATLSYRFSGSNTSRKTPFRVYPNPAKNSLKINLDGKAVEEGIPFQLIDPLGRMVLKGIYEKRGIDISTLQSGIYFLKIDQNILKFIKN